MIILVSGNAEVPDNVHLDILPIVKLHLANRAFFCRFNRGADIPEESLTRRVNKSRWLEEESLMV
jgi:hypothetical protein